MKNNKQNEMKNIKTQSAKRRGRPCMTFSLPGDVEAGDLVSVNDLWAANPHIKCRVTVYTNTKKLVRNLMLCPTDQTEPAGTIGKPGTLYEVISTTVPTRKASRKKSPAKVVKDNTVKDTVPVVDLIPAAVEPSPVPEPVAEPVAAVAEPVIVA
jgi:hypothetical protein